MEQVARQMREEASLANSVFQHVTADLVGHLCALQKSQEIMVRGFWALARTGAGFLCMGLDDIALGNRVRTSRKKITTRLQFERHFCLRQASIGTQRLATMAKMAREVGEEASVPLVRSCERILDRIERKHAT